MTLMVRGVDPWPGDLATRGAPRRNDHRNVQCQANEGVVANTPAIPAAQQRAGSRPKARGGIVRFRSLAAGLAIVIALLVGIPGQALAIGLFDANNITVTSDRIQFTIEGSFDGPYDGQVIYSSIYCIDTDSIVADTVAGTVVNEGNVVTYPLSNYDGAPHTNCAARVYSNDGAFDYQSRQRFDIPTAVASTLLGISITPADVVIGKKEYQQFTATGTYSDGETADLTGVVSWTSSDTAVASISSSGLATGHNKGTTTIGATSGNITASAPLTVDHKKPK